MSHPKIRVENLSKSFGSHHVLNGVSFSLEAKKSLVVLGGSGTGKSVLIKNIIGLMQPDSGSIFIDELNVTHFRDNERFSLMSKMGFLFQGGALFDSLSIEDNITFYTSKLWELSNSDKKDLAVKKLRSVGLDERVLKLYPSELSGGMQKRVSLARAICADPEIIFFDEPTTGLDPIMSNVINELIIKVKEELGATTITITHDMNSAFMIADTISMLYQGKILWSGSKKEIKNSGSEIVDQFINGRTEGPILV
jgi:phospholipid/cholesterol/gamma-HCH transport system ATP-binding protein